MVHFHVQEIGDQEESETYKYKAIIPHCLSNSDSLSSVKVKFGNLSQPGQMKEIRKKHLDECETTPYFDINRETITVFCNEFCDVVCTTEQKICTSKVLAMPFGRIFQVPSTVKSQTNVKIKTYLCSILFRGDCLKKVLCILT